MASWDQLLSQVAREHGLRLAHHDDPAAVWESLLAEMAGGGDRQAAKVEKDLLKSACRMLNPAIYDDGILSNLGQCIADRYHDVLSLNIDQTLSRALKIAGGGPGSWDAGNERGRFARTLTGRTTHEMKDGSVRIWYPHGITRRPTEVILGTRNYGVLLHGLARGFANIKAWEDSFAPSAKSSSTSARSRSRWQKLTRTVLSNDDPKTWLHSFMVADLVFIGAGLDRAETDIWWLLHQRQRNLVRVAPELRPRTFYVGSCDNGNIPSHLCTEPAGIINVRFRSRDDAWKAVMGNDLHA